MATAIPENSAPFSFQELVSKVGGVALLSSVAPILGVSSDTRAHLQGKAFVALQGEHFDAHDFLSRAVAGGASTLVVRDCPRVRELVETLSASSEPTPGVVAVLDPLVALGQLALAHRLRWPGRLVAVAGSAGKTTTRSAISSLLTVLFPGEVHTTRGNLNNRIGVPMTLLGLSEHHRFAVAELGTNRPGEVALLTGMARPDVSVLTLIDWEHSEGLGDLDGVEAEERAVFSTLGKGQAAIGYGEDARVSHSVQSAPADRKLYYGESSASDLAIVERRILRPDAARLTLRRKDGTELSFSTSLIGKPGALACAAAVLVVETVTGLRVSEDQCFQAFSAAGEPGRHTVVELSGPRYIIDDSYNSNPASVESSILTGREMAAQVGGRLWLVLGEMLELGAHSALSHERMGRASRESGAAGACFVQGDARHAARCAEGGAMEVRFFEDSQEVAPYLATRIRPRDVVVLKASRGVRVERVLEGLSGIWPRATVLSASEANQADRARGGDT